jgi:hypothetical protein
MTKRLAACFIALMPALQPRYLLNKNKHSGSSKQFRCLALLGVSITWALIWKRSVCLLPP